MSRASDASEALATLQARWGSAEAGGDLGLAARTHGQAPVYETDGALARAVQPLPVEAPEADDPPPGRSRSPARRRSPPPRPGLAARQMIRRPGRPDRVRRARRHPRARRGARSATSRCAATPRAGRRRSRCGSPPRRRPAGSIVAWLDLARASTRSRRSRRGVRPEWLVVLTPADLEEGLAIAGSLLAASGGGPAGRSTCPTARDPAVARPHGSPTASAGSPRSPAGRDAARRARAAGARRRPARGRGRARRAGLRLELARRSWIRLGRDVVGQRTEVIVARNRSGPPGRRATLGSSTRTAACATPASAATAPRGAPAAPPPGRIPPAIGTRHRPRPPAPHHHPDTRLKAPTID